GRIVLGKDFDSELGTGKKVYINVGANQGIKVGDYFRAVRSYTADLNDPVDSLSFKASTVEDTQRREPNIEPHMFTQSGKGPTIHQPARACENLRSGKLGLRKKLRPEPQTPLFKTL